MHTLAANQSVSARAVELRIGALIAITCAAYWPALAAFWHYWASERGYVGPSVLVIVLAAWLLVRARSRVAVAAVHGQPLVLALLIPCSVATLILWRADIASLQLLTLPALIVLAVWSAFGSRVARAIAVPVCFLYFAAPAWNELLAGPLQSLTLWIVRWVGPVLGVPATVAGTEIFLPGDMRFTVELECSGIGFLTKGLAVAVLLGELEHAPWRRRLRLVAAMVVIALVTNWIRVLALIDIGYTTQMRHVLVTRYHLEFGYVLYLCALVAFVWLATRSAQADTPPVASGAPPAQAAAVDAYLPTLAALIAAPLLVGVLALAPISAAPAAKLRLSSAAADWSGPQADEDWRPAFAGSQAETRDSYRDASGRSVEALAVSYGAQTRAADLLLAGKVLRGNDPAPAAPVVVNEGGGNAYRELVVVDEHGQRYLIWSYYDIEGRPFVTTTAAQLWFGVHALYERPAAALFAFRTACASDCAQARQTLTEFLRATQAPQLAASSRRFPS
jgi:exosortase